MNFTEIKVSYYYEATDNKGNIQTIENIIQTITGGSLKPFAAHKYFAAIIKAKETGEPENVIKQKEQDYSDYKKKLPGVTWSGTFQPTRQAKNIQQHTGLICLDFDHIDPIAYKERLTGKMDCIFLMMVSPSNAGLKVVVRTECDATNHKEYFLALQSYFKNEFGFEVDKSGKDCSRLCFLCHDKNLYINKKAQSFKLNDKFIQLQKEHTEATKLNKKNESQLMDSGEDLHAVIEFTNKVSTYTEGNRNNYIHLFACNANRKGFDLSDAIGFATGYFSDLPAREVETTVKSAYQHNTNEHGKFKKTANKKTTNSKTNQKSHSKNIRTNGISDDAGHESKGEIQKDKKIDFIQFWKKLKFKKKDENGDFYTVERIELSRVDFSDFLYQQGFHLLRTGKDGYQICRSGNGVIAPVDTHQVKQFVLNWVRHDCPDDDFKKVEEMLRKGQKQYFAMHELDALPYKEIDFQKDTAEQSFFYFRNCWVSVTADGITTHQYSELKKFIWAGSKIDFDFKLEEQTIDDENGNVSLNKLVCEFARFLYYFSYNPNNPDERDFDAETINKRFWSVAIAYGYLLDGYKHPAIRKAIFAVDHKIADKGEQNGRSGKSIIPKAAENLRVVSPINGKSFKPDWQFKYEPITADSNIVNFNDMPRNFDVENIFEVIADDYSVTRRNNGYVNFTYANSPKVYVSTNFTPKGEGSSYTGRMHIIEASDYFNDQHSPYDEFKHSLFTDWDAAEWNRFYNFSMQCVQAFKALGLLPYPKGNFDMRKLVNEVVPEFIDFFDDSDMVEKNKIIEKIELIKKFNADVYYPLYGSNLKPHTFHKWIKQMCKTRGLRFNPHKGGGHDKRNSKEYYLIATPDWKPEEKI